ncbi:MAG: phosphoribosyltransferase [Pseudomonadota bacterium]
MTDDGFIEPTTDYWQQLLPPHAVETKAPFRYGYPARLPDGRVLLLPIRRRPDDPDRAVASFIANQASFDVVDALAMAMADLARPFTPDVVVGIPTLGLALAPLMAKRLGHRHFVPLGYSRKYWYREDLAEPVRSITSPDPGKHVFLDPNLLPRVSGKRVLLVDDTVSSGTTASAVLRLLERVEARPVGLIFAMNQGDRWQEQLDPSWHDKLHAVFFSPLLCATPEGWVPEACGTG